jgi:hypothetical protein
VGIDQQTRFAYTYDFDEGWRIEIAVELQQTLKKGAGYPRCIAGERAGPPEDCGGPEAYLDMLACIKEPHSDLGREWLDWLGPGYNPDTCDLAKVNRALKKLGR